MKFIDLNGKVHSKQINTYKYGRKSESRSNFQKKVGDELQKIFPQHIILEEMPAFGTGLYIDFYIHGLKLAVEADGIQHKEFNSFFHKTRDRFSDSIRNDIKKEQWCELNKIKLVRINDKNFDNIEEIVKCMNK